MQPPPRGGTPLGTVIAGPLPRRVKRNSPCRCRPLGPPGPADLLECGRPQALTPSWPDRDPLSKAAKHRLRVS